MHYACICVCVHMRVCTYTYIHKIRRTCKYANIHTFIKIRQAGRPAGTCVYMRVRTYACICVCVHMRVYACECICVCVHMRMRVSAYACECICVCVSDRQTDKQSDRQTDRQDRQDRQTCRCVCVCKTLSVCMRVYVIVSPERLNMDGQREKMQDVTPAECP